MDIVQRVADEFQVKFDGEALSTHVMDVRMLAPSLLALGDALQAAHIALGEPGNVPTLKILATREGSFDVNLLVDALAGNAPTAAANVSGIGTAAVAVGGTVWGVVKGAIKLLKWRGSRTLQGPSLAMAPGMLIYTDHNGSTLTVPMGSDLLIENGEFRAAISGFTQPLDSAGVDTVSISDGAKAEQRPIVINELDRDSFRYQPQDLILDRTVRTATVKVETVQLSLERDRKWRFSENGETFTAGVLDQKFLLGVRSGRVPVGADDILHVRMEEVTVKRSVGGVRISRTVLEVLEHDRAPVQTELDYEF